jgi:cytochrome c peroxidase
VAQDEQTLCKQESKMWRFVSLVALAACGTPTPEPTPEPVPEPAAPTVDATHQALFRALPDAPQVKDPSVPAEVEAARVALGRVLYFDPRLSVNDTISCNSCHQLDKFGQDGEPTSPGHDGTRGGRNSPTTLNASLHFVQFWDGREPDVEAQALGPILNPVEMGMASAETVVAKLSAIPGYAPLFAAAFPGEEPALTYPNIGLAIGAFERTLLTPSPMDAYLAGDATALSPEQRAGLDLYVATGCQTCHMGVAFGGNMYQKLGLVQPYETADEGRKAITGVESDLHVFKVPSLRNVTETGPYLHDGSIASLPEMVSIMARHQLGKELSPAEVDSIVAFLGALRGEPVQIPAPEMPS